MTLRLTILASEAKSTHRASVSGARILTDPQLSTRWLCVDGWPLGSAWGSSRQPAVNVFIAGESCQQWQHSPFHPGQQHAQSPPAFDQRRSGSGPIYFCRAKRCKWNWIGDQHLDGQARIDGGL